MTDELYLLPRLGWMLYDDINRRLGILIEECLHLQQVVHYYGNFEINEKANNSEQSEMEHFKLKMQPEDYLRYSPTASAMMALYEHLGGLTKGLKSHQSCVRERFECFLTHAKSLAATQNASQQHPENEQNEAWFWFVALRGHLLHTVIEIYMQHLEHAHEKLIQILETMPGALPQPILLRRWNSALHGRFLQVYSRHVEWETNLLFNKLKHNKLDEEALRKKRHFSSFIHSWAHTPTSMVSTFKVKDRVTEANEEYQLGSIRSAFFYLEMPQLYPLLYHECAHLEFDWNSDIKNDKGKFFASRKEAIQSLVESSQQLRIDNGNFWDEYTEELWVDMVAINLGGLPYLTALTLQIFGQSSGHFFYSDPEIPLQDWAKNPIYDLERPTQYEYFWSARLELAMNWLKETRPEECDHEKIEMNSQWLEAIKLGIYAYQDGGQLVFDVKRVGLKHENWWRYRKDLNEWVYKTVKIYQEENSYELRKLEYKIFSKKYWISANLGNKVIIPVVKKFEEKFFNGEKYNQKCEYSNKILPINEHSVRRIEYLPFNIKWYLSKRVIKEIFIQNTQSMETFTFAYANYIRNDGGAAFRIALEWVMARNELNLVFADYLEDPHKIQAHFDKLDQISKKNISNVFKFKTTVLSDDLIIELIKYFRYQKHYNTQEEIKYPQLNKIKKALNIFVKYFMQKYVDQQLAETHANGAGIGTLMLGVLAKSRIKSHETYADLASQVYQHYVNTLESTNHPEKIAADATMPIDYSKTPPERFKYAIDDTRGAKPAKSGLYFITGDYDFMLHQDGITPSESIFHPASNCAMLTKSRTVLDLFTPQQEGGEYKPRQAWGRISLVKFRYRWEMYELSKQLSHVSFRSRLWLSSAWEDGVLITWHEDGEKFLEEGFFKDVPTGAVTDGTMDAQTSLFLFKIMDKDGKYSAVTCHSNAEITPLDDNKFKVEKTQLGEIIEELVDINVFKNPMASTGRFDYVVEWNAEEPVPLASAMLRLPAVFWQNTDQINTTFRFKSLKNKDSKPLFVSEIASSMFRPVEKPKSSQ